MNEPEPHETPWADRNSYSKQDESCPELVVPVEVARAIEIHMQEWREAAARNLLQATTLRDKAIDELSVISACTWKTSGELRKMARNAVQLIQNLNSNEANA